MKADSFLLLKELSEADGSSGFEGPLRDLLREKLKGIGKLSTDKLGSLICEKHGNNEVPRVMLAAHMDEIGFMVKSITDSGFIKFIPLGGWFAQVLPAKAVRVITKNGNISGVIGSKPPHLMTAFEAKKHLTLDDLFIDIGASSKKQAEKWGVSAGDPVVPEAKCFRMKDPANVCGKAFDDRAGCAVLIEVLQSLASLAGKSHPNTLFGVATVQEEVGLRGARTAAFTINPDVAIVLECRIANDFPGVKPDDLYSKIGLGPQITFNDPGLIPNRLLRDLVVDTARTNGLPFQIYTVNTGGTDGGVVHKSRSGVPTIVIGVPTRYFHSHAALINLHDLDNAVKLVTAVVLRLDKRFMTELEE